MNQEIPTPSWKGCIIFGLVNFVLVYLATAFRVNIISMGLLFLIVGGVVVSAQCIKSDWQNGFRVSALACIVGLLFHVYAGIVYVTKILGGLIMMFKK